MPANFPTSNPAINTSRADATATATNHKDDHNQAGLELNAIGKSLRGQGFNVMDYGCVGDGTTNDSTAGQAAIAAANTAGGGHVFFPAPPVAYLGNWTIPTTSPIRISGVGSASVLKAFDPAVDVLATAGVAALENSLSSGGNFRCAVENLLIDGNNPTTTLSALVNFPVAGATISVVSTTGFPATGSAASQGNYFTYSGKTGTTLTGCTSTTTGVPTVGIGGIVTPYHATVGRGLSFYGWRNDLRNLIIQNCRSDGLYTGYGADVAGQGNTVEMTSSFMNILCQSNAGDGWFFGGPHDTQAFNYLGFVNGGMGFRNYYNPAGDNGQGFHGHGIGAYANYAGGVELTTATEMSDVQTSTRDGVPGFVIGSTAGRCLVTNLIAAGDIALEVKSSGHLISGNIENCATYGLVLNGASNCIFNIVFGNCATAVRFTSDLGGNMVYGKVITASGGQVLKSGTVSESTTLMMRADGVAGVEDMFRFPQSASVWIGSDLRLQRGVADTFLMEDFILSSQTIAAGILGGSQGHVKMVPGGTTTVGYIEWRKSDGTRLGYMGGGANEIAMNCENSAHFRMSGGALGLSALEADTAPNDALFRDDDTSQLTYKDISGVVTSMESRGLKLPVRVAAPVNTTISAPGATVDGVTMVAGDRMLLATQTTASQNGVYIWNGAASAATRATDSDTALKMTDSLLVTVDEGTTNKDSIWTLSTNKPITVGTTALRFTRIHPAAVAVSQPAGIYFDPAASKLENMPRAQTDFPNQALLATGTVRVFPMGVLRAGDTLATLNFVVGTTASAAITNSWAGIARLSDRVVLAVSATSTATTAANTLKTFTFTSAFTADRDELLVGFVMYQATTVPSMFGINHGNAVIISNPPITNGTSNTGATTPVAVAATLTAFTADTEIPYCYAT